MEKIKKVLLVNPSKFVYTADFVPPVVLGYLAAWIMKNDNVEVKISDEAAGSNVIEDMEEFKPDLVGITSMTEFAFAAYKIAEEARKRGILTVMGGKHATVLPEEAAKHVDIVVVGPGELVLSEIINGRRDSIIEGTTIDNIDLIPPIPWDKMDMPLYMSNYRTIQSMSDVFWPSKLGFIMTSRGCPYSCIYCYNSSKNRKFQFMSPERVVSDIKELVDKYDVGSIFVIDDNFLANRRRLKEICRLIIENGLNIKWTCASSVNFINDETLQMIKEAGCVQVSFGFESGSQRMLSLLKNNRFSVEDNRKAIKLCKKAGIKVCGFFVLGTPTETRSEIQETIDFIKENEIDSVNIQHIKPYPGTGLWELCKEKKTIPDNFSWNDYDQYSFSDNFTWGELSGFLVEVLNETNKYTLKRVVQRVLHQPTIVFGLFYNERIRHIAKTFLKNLVKGGETV